MGEIPGEDGDAAVERYNKTYAWLRQLRTHHASNGVLTQTTLEHFGLDERVRDVSPQYLYERVVKHPASIHPNGVRYDNDGYIVRIGGINVTRK